MKSKNYNPEEYWSEVGLRIARRGTGKNIIAGDDEPYYRYKRKEFIKMLRGVDFNGKSVLEIGVGPGGNLMEIYKLKPKRLVGVDISDQMIRLAKNKLETDVEILKINGTNLPFGDKEFDIVFTATVLQHNTDESILNQIMSELARVSKKKVFLFERIEKEIKGDELCLGRPVSYYSKIMESHGFKLQQKSFINIRSSYYISGAIRKGLNPESRAEGEPLNYVSTLLQNLTLPITRITDKLFKSENDICRMTFERVDS